MQQNSKRTTRNQRRRVVALAKQQQRAAAARDIPGAPTEDMCSHIDTSRANASGSHTHGGPTQEGTVHTTLQDILQISRATPHPLMLVLTLNMRSCQELFKVYHLIDRMRSLPSNADIAITIQETWLRSDKARQELRPVLLGAGWNAQALDRSTPDENRSGGLLTLVREGTRTDTDRLHERHEIIDSLGVTCCTLYRTREQEDTRIIEHSTAVFNAYVPTGTNLLDPTREAQMTDRFIGAVKHACQHNAKVVATGDWNHLTEEWLDHLTKLGFRTAARQGVVVIAVRDNDAPILGGLTTENLQTTHPLFSDHPILFTHLTTNDPEDTIFNDPTIDRALCAQHKEEFQEY